MTEEFSFCFICLSDQFQIQPSPLLFTLKSLRYESVRLLLLRGYASTWSLPKSNNYFQL